MKILPEFFEVLRNRINVSDVVRTKVNLIKKSGEYHGLCPFHHEKTPSFTVNDNKKFYYCFGCSAAGDVIKFTASISGLSYKESAIKLAGDYGIDIPRYTKEQENLIQESDQLIHILDIANNFFVSKLNHQVLSYLKSRGLSDQIIDNFTLGYAPYNELQKFFDTKSIPLLMLIKSGLAGKREDGKIYEIFNDRIMFPIRNVYGKVVAFGGRAMKDKMPKYLNSPETILFKKSNILYGEHIAISASYKTNFVILVEGYMDAIALHNHHFPYTVASLGTAVTEEHLKKLWRSCDEVIICLDGDNAGIRASNRVIDLSLPLVNSEKKISFIRMPMSYDPDKFLQDFDREAFEKLLSQRLSLSEFIWYSEFDGQNFSTAESRAQLEKRLKNYCKKITEKTLSINYNRFFQDQIWNNIIKTKKISTSKENLTAVKIDMPIVNHSELEILEHALFSILFKFPSLIEQEPVYNFFEFNKFINHKLEHLKEYLFTSCFANNELQKFDHGSFSLFINNATQNNNQPNSHDNNEKELTQIITTLLKDNNIFFDTSNSKYKNISPLTIWDFLYKNYYLRLLRHEYNIFINKNSTEDFSKAIFYQQEMTKTIKDLEQLTEIFSDIEEGNNF